MKTKHVDSRGRLTLGKEFAGRIVNIRKLKDGRVVIAPLEVADHEAWLYRSPKALASVRRGLAQAKAGHFVEGPDLDATKPRR